jgi:long-chain acyl-CoA synthetase
MQTSAQHNYPAGVPLEIHPEQYRSLPHMFDEAFARHADKPFSVCMERWMSYGELDALSKALGAWLQSRGLEPGARVAIMLPNIPQFAVTMCGVLRAGYTCVNVNPLYTARELEHQLKDSGATAIVILENFASTLEKVIERTPIKHVVMTSMGDLLGGLYGAWITRRCGTWRRSCRRTSCRWTKGAPSRRSTKRSPKGAAARWGPTRARSTRSLSCSTRAAPRACRRARC